MQITMKMMEHLKLKEKRKRCPRIMSGITDVLWEMTQRKIEYTGWSW